MSEVLGISVRTIKTKIKQLKEAGLLEISKLKAKNGNLKNVYVVVEFWKKDSIEIISNKKVDIVKPQEIEVVSEKIITPKIDKSLLTSEERSAILRANKLKMLKMKGLTEDEQDLDCPY